MFSEQNQKELLSDLGALEEKYESQLLKFLAQRLLDPRAVEFARHGYARRLKLMVRCIENVFVALPVDSQSLPLRDELSNAVINAQALIFNSFGAIDNLAWILVHEKSLKNSEGNDLPPSQVGLGPKSKAVRTQLSPELQAYLTSMKLWFGYMGNFRHALAHRIPLYIPPHMILNGNAEEYHRLEDAKDGALFRRDMVEHGRLDAAQRELVKFTPVMTHSFREESAKVIVHAQVLADFHTVHALGEEVLKELER